MNDGFMLNFVAYAIVAACAVLAWRELRPRKAVGIDAGRTACGGCNGCADAGCKSGDGPPG